MCFQLSDLACLLASQMSIPWTTVQIQGVEVKFDSKVVLGSEDGAEKLGPANSPHFLYFLNTSSLTFYGKDVPRTTARVEVQFIGPGSIVRFLFTIPDLGEIVMFQTHLPLLENRGLAQRIRYQVDSRMCGDVCVVCVLSSSSLALSLFIMKSLLSFHVTLVVCLEQYPKSARFLRRRRMGLQLVGRRGSVGGENTEKRTRSGQGRRPDSARAPLVQTVLFRK